MGFNLKKYKYEYKRGEEEYKLYRIDTKNKNDNLILIFLWRSKSDLWKICKVKRHFIFHTKLSSAFNLHHFTGK